MGRTGEILTEVRSAEVRMQPGSGPNTNAGLAVPTCSFTFDLFDL